jgi:hypothetical protein
MDAAPQLQMELILPSTFDQWQIEATRHSGLRSRTDALRNYQQQVWDRLHQMPSQLPRMRIVEPGPDDQ